MEVKYHMSLNINGLLLNYGKKSLKGFFLKEDGKECTNKEAREYISECQEKGYKVLPMCLDSECPDFDYSGGGCPGHKVSEEEKNNQNEICKNCKHGGYHCHDFICYDYSQSIGGYITNPYKEACNHFIKSEV